MSRTDTFDQEGRYDPAPFRDVVEHSFTYLAGFERNTHRYADRTALSEPASGRSWTYAELGEATDRVAGALYRLGVHAHRLVMVELLNGPEFAILYPTTQKLRAVFAPTNFRLAAGEVAFILDDARPAVLVYDTSRSDVIAQALEIAEHTPLALVAVGPGPRVETEEIPTLGFDELLGAEPLSAVERAENERGLGPVSTYDETTRLFTSGTTGMPKPVPLPSLVEVFSAHDVIMHFPLRPQDRTLNMSPLFHRGGLYSGGPNPVFYVGAHNVTLRSFDPDVVLDLVPEQQLTYLIGAPANLYALAEAQERRPRDLSSLLGIVTMGAPLDKVAALRFQKVLTPRIFNGYGTSETFWNTFLRPEDLPDGAGSTGRASTDDDVAVVRVFEDHLADPTDPADRVPQDGTSVGEFAVRTVKSGYSYLGDEQTEREKFHDGWFFPGDLATWDQEEMVTIVGRKDDMIISGGENVHPVQVEEALTSHDGVADSIVVGVQDPAWGEKIVVYVVRAGDVLPPGDAEAAAVLDEYAGTHPLLARYKRPRLYRFVEPDQVPYNATGKKVHYLQRDVAATDLAEGRLIEP
jgi:acyl-CoA synthetase (AMP-forming)/AMP-acid ligase II